MSGDPWGASGSKASYAFSASRGQCHPPGTGKRGVGASPRLLRAALRHPSPFSGAVIVVSSEAARPHSGPAVPPAPALLWALGAVLIS